MPSLSSGIAPQIVRAYREALYVLRGPDGNIDLKVGVVSNRLSSQMKEWGVATGALLTTHNPHSQRRSEAENEASQETMDAELEKLGFRTLKGEGRSPSGDWPAETSTFVFGMVLTDAEELARKYEQNGFLWVGTPDGFCSLRLLRPLLVPDAPALTSWRKGLSAEEATVAALLSPREQGELMSIGDAERKHWLFPNLWRLDQPWPYTRPDGSAIGIGTELDRNFKLIAAGMTATFSEYV
jgi:hypothetical protein